MEKPAKLINRNFLLLWQGLSVSRLGIQAFEIAMLFWIKHATESATLIGLMLMLSNLPAVALGPIGGAFADRYSRRKIILLSEALNGIAVLSLAGLLFAAPDATDMILVWLFVVSFFSAIVSSFFGPAFSAAIPDLVPEDRVATANSLNQFAVQISVFIGQSIGGTLFRLLGAPILFLINGFTYLFSAASVVFVTIPQTIPEGNPNWARQFTEFKQDIVNGLRFVWGKRGIKELVFVSAFLSFFTVPIIVLLPFYVEDFLKVQTDWYGFLLAAFGVGSVIGYVLAGTLKLKGQTRSRVMMACIILESSGYGLLGLADNPLVALGLALLGGCVSGFVTIIITTILQITTPSEMRGRVFGLLTTLAGSITPIAMGLAGVIADLLDQNIPLIYISCGIIMAGLSLSVSLNREFRDFMAFEHEELHTPVIEKQIVPIR